ncbi:Enolase [Lachnellula arida]|uniref:Enolase n=1 Tax=Lachnellula arida TaxID=1316785 RepID=A0A8T9B833_9HELO|nr:Enolase [Lachnellula arida]
MSLISAITAAQRLDSRGVFKAIVPSGASKGDYEAVELRDGDQKTYHGQGVLKAISNVETIIRPALIAEKFKVFDLESIDGFMRKLDGTSDKSKLGANAILGVSMACARAGAAAKVGFRFLAVTKFKTEAYRRKDVPLYDFIRLLSGTPLPYVMPVPFFNVLNGGMHSGNSMAFQEFMIAPVGAKSFTDAVRMGSEVYQELKSVLKSKFGGSAIGVGDEGGFAPPISRPEEALDLLIEAVERCNYTGKVKFGIDPASQEFLLDRFYDLGFKSSDSKKMSSADMQSLYHELIKKYPVVLLEDPFGQDDWESWTEFRKTCKIELVGDDLLATNVTRIKTAGEKKACNALLLKINQIGTITEAIEAAKLAYSYGWSVFVSHRSGETTDDFIADLTVALGTGHLKSGSPCRGERVAKYNRLMDIEQELQTRSVKSSYAGEKFGQTRSV